MRVLLLGATGQIGSAVLPALLDRGHQVTALVRSDASAATVSAAGADAVRGDLLDPASIREAAAGADAIVNVASTGDEKSAEGDEVVLSAALDILAGTRKPYVHTGGAWVHGSHSEEFDETAPYDPPQLTAWRIPLGQRVLEADGVRGILIAPGIVYGDGGGLPAMLTGGPRQQTEDGEALVMFGDGNQHWSTIHVDDIGRLYALAVESAPAGTYLFAVSGSNPTVREIAEAASRGQGLDGRVVAEGRDATLDRLGPVGEALLLDQQASAERAKTLLGWEPSGPSMLDDLATGSYAAR